MSNAKKTILLLVVLICGTVLTGCGTSNKVDEEQQSAAVTVDKTRTVYSGFVTDTDSNAIEGAKLHILRHANIKAISGQQGEYNMSWNASRVPEAHDIYIIARHEEKYLACATKVSRNTQTRNIILLPAVTATGAIIDIEGNPIENAYTSFGFYAKGYITSFAEHRRYTVDSRGVYKVPFVPRKNRYSVRFRAEGYGSERIMLNSDDAVDGVFKIDPIVLLNADQTISGVVVDSDGKPVIGARVFTRSEHQPGGSEETDTDGTFTIAVCKGKVVLMVSFRKNGTRSSGRVTVPSGSEDVKIVLEPR